MKKFPIQRNTLSFVIRKLRVRIMPVSDNARVRVMENMSCLQWHLDRAEDTFQ